jgi:phage tail-like protein
MAQEAQNYLQTNKFRVTLENSDWDRFIEVGGLGINFEVISNNEGGKNTMDLKPGRARMGRITLKRRFRNDATLMKWIKEIQEGKNSRKAGSVILLDDEGKTEVTRFNFFRAFPCEWHAPHLSTQTDSESAIETIVLAVEDVEMAS